MTLVAVLGEALIDLVPADQDRASEADHNLYRALPGGSSANVAVGLARLETSVAFLGRLSTDGFGEQLRHHLAADGVELDAAPRTDAPTTIAAVTFDENGQAKYAFHLVATSASEPGRVTLPDTATVVFAAGSLALGLPSGGPVPDRLLTSARAAGAIVVLDPNLRPQLLGGRNQTRQRLEAWLEPADIVKVSDEDLGWAYPDEPAKDVAARWASNGRLVVLTRGQHGAIAWWSGQEISVAGEQVDLVDSVGAGDAFTAGLLDALARVGRLNGRDALGRLNVDDLRAAVAAAVHVSAVTCTRSGADPPRRPELLS